MSLIPNLSLMSNLSWIQTILWFLWEGMVVWGRYWNLTVLYFSFHNLTQGRTNRGGSCPPLFLWGGYAPHFSSGLYILLYTYVMLLRCDRPISTPILYLPPPPHFLFASYTYVTLICCFPVNKSLSHPEKL